MIRKYRNVILAVVVLLLTVICMCFVWNVKLKNLPMPIQHNAKIISGEFNITIGTINEIMVKTTEPQTASLQLIIFDESNEELWKGQYENINLTSGYRLIESSEDDFCLELETGKYRVECRIDGEKTDIIRCCFIEHSGSFRMFYTVLCTLLLLGLSTIFIVVSRKSISLEKAYIILMLTMGIIFNFAFPPCGVPDERDHFLEAYGVASDILGQERYEPITRRMYIRADDYDSMFYLHNIASIAGWYDSFEKGDTHHTVMADTISSVSIRTAYAYAAPAIGITIARLFDWSGHTLLLVGRLFNLFVLTLLAAWAIKLMPYGKGFLFVLGLSPEVVFLFASYSYDGINLALCMLIIAYFLHLSIDADKIGWRQIFAFIILILLMIPIKVAYISFGLLLFMIPGDKLTITRKQIIVCIAVGMAGAMYLFGSKYFIYIKFLLLETGIKPGETGDLISVGYVLQHPMDVCRIYLNTIFRNSLGYIKCAFGQIIGRDRYMEQVGYVIPVWMWTVIVLLLILGLEDTDKNVVSGRKRIVAAGIAVISYICILSSLFFSKTVIADEIIQGMQGRYLLPIFALLPVMVQNRKLRWQKDKRGVYIVSMGLLDSLYIFSAVGYYATNYFA